MKIRERILITGTIIALTLFLSLTYLTLIFEGDSANKIIEEIALQKEFAFKKLLERELLNLKRFCMDWAIWDDTYEFVREFNENYITSNLLKDTFVNAKINLMVFFDREGKVVYVKFYDRNWNEKEPPEVFSTKELMGKDGYLYQNGDVFVLTSSPILKSDGSGEANGFLLMGRILNDEIAEFEKILMLSKIKINAKAENLTKSDLIVRSLYVEDVFGKEIPFSLEMRNPITEILYTNFLLLLGGFLFVVFFIFVLSVLFVEKGLISKLLKLEEFTREASSSDRITLKGLKEIESLGKGINDMLERISKAEEELRFLLKVLRHDLMNVFTSVRGYLELYKTEKDLKLLERVEKYVDRGINIIKVVKQLEKAELGEFEIRKVIEEVKKAFPIEVEISGDAKVLADEGIYTIFGNLIDNAIKHGKANKIYAEIKKGDQIVVKFWDNGTGFSEKAKENLFKREYNEKGSGMGLFIVKKLMEKYEGKLEFEGKNTLILYFPDPDHRFTRLEDAPGKGRKEET
ncbi:MAG: CHASE4 domain-containing protein [Archaeoglobaceae archaeon]